MIGLDSNSRQVFIYLDPILIGERGGSVVECRTPEREVRGSKPTAAVLCPWARHFTPRKYWLLTQEAMAPSRYDWKIVDWDVKPQHNQPTHFDLYQSLNRLPIWNSQNCSMFPLAFVAGWLQGHWWVFISRNYVVWPTFFFMNVFIALKGYHFWFYISHNENNSAYKFQNPSMCVYAQNRNSCVECFCVHAQKLWNKQT